MDATPWQQKMTLTASDEQQIVFETRRRDLPTPVPSAWQVEELTDKKVKVTISADLAIKHDSTRDNPIKAAGQLPTGFEPSAMYNSRYQPRLASDYLCRNRCNSFDRSAMAAGNE